LKEGSGSKLGEGGVIAERRLSVPGDRGGMSRPGYSREREPKGSGNVEDAGSAAARELAG